MNGRARRLAALNAFDLSARTEALPVVSDDTEQLKPVTAPLPAQHVYGGLWLVPLLLIVIAVLVAAGLLPLVILLGVFG